MNGKLFTEDFLLEGIRERPEWARLAGSAGAQPDAGHSAVGDPFPWDEDDRRHRMARLDALFFHLYGLDKNDADYVLNTFPIIRADDEKHFDRFLTRDLILAYMNAVAAGDLETTVSV